MICPVCGESALNRFYPECETLFECRACGVIHDTRVEADTTYYEEQRIPRVDKEKLKSRQRNVKQRVRLIRSILTKDSSLLDIGCGEGLFIKEVAPHVAKAVGLEPTKFYAEYASGTLGLDVRQGLIEMANFPPESFDVIAMFHVLEHLENPVAALSQLHSWLKPGGVVVIEVPNIQSPTARYRGMSWELITPEHRFHYTPSSLTRLLESGQYQVMRVLSRDFDQYRTSIGKNLRKLFPVSRRRGETELLRQITVGDGVPTEKSSPKKRSCLRRARKFLQLPLTSVVGWLTMVLGKSDYLFVIARKRL